MDYDLEEWLSHGGPDAAATREITTLMTDAIADDGAGLRVRPERDRLRFTHRAAVFLATPAS